MYIDNSGGEYMVFPGAFQVSAPKFISESNGQIDREELKYYLNIFNISYDTLILIIVAISLNLYYVYRSRIDTLDALNNTSCGKNQPSVEWIPEFGNMLFLYITAVFLIINYDDYMRKVNAPCDKRDEVAIAKAYNAFFAALLAYIAAVISRRNYDIDVVLRNRNK